MLHSVQQFHAGFFPSLCAPHSNVFYIIPHQIDAICTRIRKYIYIYIYVANCANACKWMQSASNCSLSAITNHLTTSITNHLTSRLLVCAQNPCWHWRWIRRRVKHRSMYTMITFNLLVLEIVLHEVRHVANVPTTNGKWATSPLVLTSCSLANLRIFFPARVYPTNPRLNQAQVQCLSSMS